MRTIELPDEVADALEARASRAGLPLADVLRILAASAEGDGGAIRSRPDVMGGDDCVRDTRIPVWLLVSAKRQGQTDAEILEGYPGLTALDLAAVWAHFAQHPDRILEQQRENEADD